MRKTTVITAALLAALLLGGCGLINPGPEPTPMTPPTSTPARDVRTLVSVSFPETVEKHYAPDVSDLAIVSFSYLTPKVRIQGNDAASEKINEAVALQSEFFYSGNEKYIGVSGYHEIALDAYTYAKETQNDVSYEFYAERKATSERCDERTISLRFTISSYLGGSAEEYSIEGMTFETASGRLLSLNDVVSSRKTAEKKVSDAYTSWQKTSGCTSAFDAKMLDSCQWYLSSGGLTVVLDTPEIRSAVYAPLELTISYDTVKEAYRLCENTNGGSVRFVSLSNVVNGTTEIVDRVVVKDGGEEYLLIADGRVSDVSVYRVSYSGDSFFKTGEIWSANEMKDNAVQISTVIPNGIPDLMVCYLDASGSRKETIVSFNAKDASFELTETIEVLG